MQPIFRRLVMMITALAFISTSGGGSMASALLPFAPGSGHHLAGEAATADTRVDQDGKVWERVADCFETDSHGAGVGHGDSAGACCAMACHAVMAVAFDAMILAVVRAKTLIMPDDGASGAEAARLERPPRVAAA